MPELHSLLEAALGTRYRIERELGGGGMSRVFVAEEMRFGRTVVIKVLTRELAAGLSAERFEREIQIAAQLQQANIVPVLGAGEIVPSSGENAAAFPYYTMPFVDGESLRVRMETGRLPLADAIAVLRDVARALSYAHDRGVVHRDVKPENVLLSGGAAVVTDFGIAKAVSASKSHAPGGTLTVVGTSLGTPAYMAPEQAAGGDVDHRADLYSWGVIAYELLAGRHPFAHRTTPQQLMAAHVTELPTSLSQAAAEAPRSLVALIMRCLEKDPARRPPSAAALLDALSASGDGHRRTEHRRTRRMVAAALLGALVAAGGLVWRHSASASPGTAPTTSRVPSNAPTLAVLPFANLSGDSAQQYFADGLADELTTALGRTPGLQVTSRSAAFAAALRGLDATTAGRRLHVSTVLEGAVRRAGHRIRLSAYLVNVHDGTVLWSDEFEHDGDDIFAAQDDLTRRVAAGLHDRLAITRSAGATFDRGTADEAAYDLYLRARYLFARRGEANLLRAAALLSEAIHRDSTFARAMATLAMVQVVLPEYVQVPAGNASAAQQMRDTINAAGLRNAARAIKLDSTLADAYIAQGYGLIARWDWARSEASFRRALTLEPLNPEVHHWHADLLFARGDLAGTLNEQRRAEQLDPTSAIVVAEIANDLYTQRRYAEAIATGRRASEMDPGLSLAYLNYVAAFIMTGRADSALAVITKGVQAGGQGQIIQAYALRAAALTVAGRPGDARRDVARVEAAVGHGGSAYTAALARVGIGDREGALRWLARSIDAGEREDAMYGVSCDPMFDPLKRDPRFIALMQRMDVHVCPAV